MDYVHQVVIVKQVLYSLHHALQEHIVHRLCSFQSSNVAHAQQVKYAQSLELAAPIRCLIAQLVITARRVERSHKIQLKEDKSRSAIQAISVPQAQLIKYHALRAHITQIWDKRCVDLALKGSNAKILG